MCRLPTEIVRIFLAWMLALSAGACATPDESATPADKVTNAKIVYRLAPAYPAEALAKRIEGWVHLSFTVTKDGRTRNIRVIGSDPPGYFEESAIDAVSRLRYQPELINGKPVDADDYKVLLRYTLPE